MVVETSLDSWAVTALVLRVLLLKSNFSYDYINVPIEMSHEAEKQRALINKLKNK